MIKYVYECHKWYDFPNVHELMFAIHPYSKNGEEILKYFMSIRDDILTLLPQAIDELEPHCSNINSKQNVIMLKRINLILQNDIS